MTHREAALKDLAQLEADYKVYSDREETPPHEFLDYYHTRKAEINNWLSEDDEEECEAEISRTRRYERGY